MKLFVIIDAWDRHHCVTAQQQIDLRAPEIDVFARAARKRGYRVVHSPAGCMGAYARHRSRAYPPIIRRRQLRRAQYGRRSGHLSWPETVARPAELDGPPCACRTLCRPKERVWSSQHKSIAIFPEDLVAESVHELHIMLGGDTRFSRVLLAGFHLDQCVLTRRLGYFAFVDICPDTAILADASWSFTGDAAREAAIRQSLVDCGIRLTASGGALTPVGSSS
jgi:nicotinamidase-related amidase